MIGNYGEVDPALLSPEEYLQKYAPGVDPSWGMGADEWLVVRDGVPTQYRRTPQKPAPAPFPWGWVIGGAVGLVGVAVLVAVVVGRGKKDA